MEDTERSYLLAHPSETEKLVVATLKQYFANKDYEQHILVEGFRFPFVFKHQKLVIDIEEETHDHSDGYYRNVRRHNALLETGHELVILAAFECLKSPESILVKLQKALD